MWSSTLLPTGFIPAEDTSRVVVSLELPTGAVLAWPSSQPCGAMSGNSPVRAAAAS